MSQKCLSKREKLDRQRRRFRLLFGVLSILFCLAAFVFLFEKNVGMGFKIAAAALRLLPYVLITASVFLPGANGKKGARAVPIVLIGVRFALGAADALIGYTGDLPFFTMPMILRNDVAATFSMAILFVLFGAAFFCDCESFCSVGLTALVMEIGMLIWQFVVNFTLHAFVWGLAEVCWFVGIVLLAGGMNDKNRVFKRSDVRLLDVIADLLGLDKYDEFNEFDDEPDRLGENADEAEPFRHSPVFDGGDDERRLFDDFDRLFSGAKVELSFVSGDESFALLRCEDGELLGIEKTDGVRRVITDREALNRMMSDLIDRLGEQRK